MKRNFLLPIIIILTAVIYLSGCGKRYTLAETETHTINAVNKSSFRLSNTNGQIIIRKNVHNDELKVTAKKTLKVRKREIDKPPESLRIEIDTSGTEINIKSDARSQRKLFNFGLGEKIDYEVFIPENISVVIKNVNGEIMIERISNDVNVTSVNGSVTLNNTTGNLDVETTNGKISCSTFDMKGINFKTVNGAVEILIPDSINASLTAKVTNGKISYSGLNVVNIVDEKKKFSGQLGSFPGISINAETVNGKITFEKYMNTVPPEIYSGKSKITGLEQAELEMKEAEKMFEEKKEFYEKLKEKSADTLKKGKTDI